MKCQDLLKKKKKKKKKNRKLEGANVCIGEYFRKQDKVNQNYPNLSLHVSVVRID